MQVELTKDEMLLLCICVFEQVLKNRRNGVLDSSSESQKLLNLRQKIDDKYKESVRKPNDKRS
tara:strand:+ start:33087 stop:33275 length:189 start_codon:yes stop_codon:yes gene_type:complete